MVACCSCVEAERTAGAIALGEADDALRDRYRLHLSTCGPCANDLGGERELERMMATVREARDVERWEPEMRQILTRPRPARPAWKLAAGLAAAVVIAVAAPTMHARWAKPPAAPRLVGSSEQIERAIASVSTQTVPRREHQAESLVFQTIPSRTVRIEMRLDKQGIAERCTIVESSGRPKLDVAVCRAAMRAAGPAPQKQ